MITRYLTPSKASIGFIYELWEMQCYYVVTIIMYMNNIREHDTNNCIPSIIINLKNDDKLCHHVNRLINEMYPKNSLHTILIFFCKHMFW